MKGHKAGGGFGSNKLVRAPATTGASARGVNPKNVSQIGSSLGNHSTDRGDMPFKPERIAAKAPTAAGVKLGNERATEGIGVGGGRIVHRSGSQAQHGAVAGSPRPQGRDILGEFGPDSPNARARR